MKLNPMKKATRVALFAAVLFAICFVASSANAQSGFQGKVKECSNDTLQGSFGYTSTGTLIALPPPFAGPFAEVGRQTFDGKGKTDSTATTSSNGNIVKVTIVGTYTVNKDCTGSMTLFVTPFDATVHADFVISDDGAELRAIVSDSGFVESRVYSKQFRGGRNE